MDSRLQNALEWLDGGKRWTKGRYAKGENGVALFVRAADVTHTCVVGALARVWDCDVVTTGNPGYTADLIRLAEAAKTKGFNSPSQLNDDPKTTFEMVADLLKTAIEQT